MHLLNLNIQIKRKNRVFDLFLKGNGDVNYIWWIAGYCVSYAIAKENLELGLDVVDDSVNSIAITRHDWRKVAIESNKRFIEIELICSDKKEHQYRVEERVADINGHKLPSWNDVYEPWNSRSMVVDTSMKIKLLFQLVRLRRFLNL